PPNPNDRHFERDGFKPLLQPVYSISSNRNKAEDAAVTDRAAVDFDDILSTLPLGFVVMNSDSKILYSNKAAPVRINSDGNRSLELLFDNNDDLKKWVKECTERSVHAEKVWLRIANKIPGEENRKIYDISATYQKGKSAEVILTLLD